MFFYIIKYICTFFVSFNNAIIFFYFNTSKKTIIKKLYLIINTIHIIESNKIVYILTQIASQNSTPSRRRLFDPKNQDINHAFGVTTHPTAPTPSKKMNTLSIQPQRSISESRNNNTTTATTTTTSSNPDITSMNNTTATTTTTTSSDQTTTTTSSSDKSIPGGQYPNNQAVTANDNTNNDTNKTTSMLVPFVYINFY